MTVNKGERRWNILPELTYRFDPQRFALLMARERRFLKESDLPCEISDITEYLQTFPYPPERVGFEAGTLSQHLFFGLTAGGNN